MDQFFIPKGLTEHASTHIYLNILTFYQQKAYPNDFVGEFYHCLKKEIALSGSGCSGLAMQQFQNLQWENLRPH